MALCNTGTIHPQEVCMYVPDPYPNFPAHPLIRSHTTRFPAPACPLGPA